MCGGSLRVWVGCGSGLCRVWADHGQITERSPRDHGVQGVAYAAKCDGTGLGP